MVSCKSDILNSEIKGVVENEQTGLPLANIEIQFTNWYYGNSPDQSYAGMDEKTIITNDKGEFKISFSKSAFLEIRVERGGYLEFHETKYITNKCTSLKIELVPK